MPAYFASPGISVNHSASAVSIHCVNRKNRFAPRQSRETIAASQENLSLAPHERKSKTVMFSGFIPSTPGFTVTK
ncbi:hypothetical protein [Burkholderia contaminans]|uniref:hypothetical protein n=1 Tax=Burkholderia contaminans TaxID=488447 RepID=UPI0015834E5B|nr:hypothetical protein [Burkholderia contaminans]